jgi:hypothetical protein
MKEMAFEEFRDRLLEFQKARKIFVTSGLTNNITHAFEAYQEILAREKKKIYLNTKDHGKKVSSIFDGLDRPECVECQAQLYFRAVPKNKKGILAQLVCTNSDCQRVYNSKIDLETWADHIRQFGIEAAQRGVYLADRSTKAAPRPGIEDGLTPATCPECKTENMYIIKACCGAPNGYLWCSHCSYELVL